MRIVRTASVTVLLAFSCFGWFPALAAAHGPIHEQIAALTNLLKEDPQNAALYLKRGELHSYHRHWPAALADYERAALLDPTLAAVDFARGKTLLHAGSPGQAKSALDRFLAKHPEHAEALATRARVLVILGERLAATADYTRAIAAMESLGRPKPEYYLERARALTGKRYDAALARLDTLASQSARKESWLVRRGEILEQAGRAAQARLAYEQALAAIESLPARHRTTETTAKLEAQIRAALARRNAEADP